ncbi:hypothetical protein FY048_08900 [Acinetobacter sp. 1124_18A]|uniref:DUF2515 family protein n=1 Tax=Acinetobacter sp. 1124_18A TaxID=2605958 RepID=UPI00405851E5
MSGSLDWDSNTNTTENSCKTVQCDCSTFWEIYQQEAIKRVSNLKNANHYKLEPGYEARARRIASVYARIYLEQEISGIKQFRGRYYWMGLGAFASKTVAAIFKHGLTAWGYKWAPVISGAVGGVLTAPVINSMIRDPIHSFAKGNLWLFMDIAPWHYAWSASSASFKSCKKARKVSGFKHIKKEVENLPWSNSLSVIKQLGWTDQIEEGFGYLPDIESTFKRAGKTRNDNFKTAAKNLFDHLMAIAVQEQYNILQELVWKEWKVQKQASLQRITGLPDSTLVLSSDYGVDAVKPNKQGQHKGRHAGVLSQLPETVYSEPLEGTQVENYDSRIKWIKVAAGKYHRLMQSDKGRDFLEKELGVIAGWGDSKAEFKVGKDSNDGKI